MLLGLSGYAGAGKDSVGAILVERFGFTRLAFADKIRETALAVDPYVWDNGFGPMRLSAILSARGGWDAAKAIPGVRELLQRLGAAGRDVLGDHVWIDAVMCQRDPAIPSVVTDVRVLSEAWAIESRDGEVWRINRPGYGPVNGDITEHGLDVWPFTTFINNSGSPDDLAEVVELAINRARA